MNAYQTEDQVKANISIWQMLKSVWPFCRRYPWMLAASVFAILGVAISSRLLPTIVGYAIDHGIIPKNAEVLTYAAFAFLAVEIGHALFLFFYQYLFQSLGNRVLFDIRNALIEHTQNLPMSYFDKTPLGRTVTRLTNDTATLGEIFTEGVINLITETAVLIAIIVSLLLISPKLTFFTLILAPLFVYISFRITVVIREILRESKKRLSILNSFTAENINGIKVVQLFNRVYLNRKRFAALSRDYRDTLIRSVRQYAFLQPIMNMFNAVTISIALYYGGILGTENAIALGALVAFLMHIQDIVPPLREILEKYQAFQNSLTSSERVFHLLEEKPEVKPVTPVYLENFKGHVEFKNLNFRYSENLAYVIKNLNLTIPPHQSLAIIGRTGSGKTTLISLLQKMYLAPESSIFIDDVAIENISNEVLRRHIGVVQQDNFIFRGTLSDNVGLGDPNISHERIHKALERVGFLDLLKRTNRSFDFLIEERGANLSLGERQLIAFARILAFEPDILILDEATSNIDSETEQLIQHATEEVTRKRTSIIIAHRLSTIRKCDHVIVLENGKIIDQGSPQVLLQKPERVIQHFNELKE